MTTQETRIEERVSALLHGAVDPHVHSGPSSAARLLDHVELARQASARGLAAVITKDHDYSGVATAALIRDNFRDLGTRVYSGIVLNNVVGGLNPYAVEHTAVMGGKIVWLPTLAAANHLHWQKTASFAHPGVGKASLPITPVLATQDGVVRDDMKAVLDVIASSNMVLAAGHLHVSEIWLVFEEAKRRGVSRLLVNHPEEVIDASLNDVKGLAALGAHIEHSLSLFVEGSRFKLFDESQLDAQIRAAGVDSTILCSDLGQINNIGPVEGMAEGIRMCISLGYSDDDIRKMVSTNAARLFDIEADLPARLS